jgi:hypothetical protein
MAEVEHEPTVYIGSVTASATDAAYAGFAELPQVNLVVRVTVHEQVQERRKRCFHIFFADCLVGVVGEAAGGSEEEHRGRYSGGEDHSVMTGA